MQRSVVAVVGWKKAGKTTLVENLVAELTRRGVSVSTVKHAHHDADTDKEGTDSFRHRAAGAREVLLVTGRRWALLHEFREEAEPPLADMLAHLAPADIVVIEGYKSEPIPKIEVRGQSEDREPLAPTDPNVIAVVTDDSEADTSGRPRFRHEEAAAIADFLALRFGLSIREVAAVR